MGSTKRSSKCCYPYGNSFFCTLPMPCKPKLEANIALGVHLGLVHPGSQKCRAMIGPHWMGVVMTIGVILGGTMMNLRIIKHSQPISPAKLLALHVFIAIFCSLSILLLLLTATTDPGIVYPNLDDYDTQLLGNLPGNSSRNYDRASSHSSNSLSQDRTRSDSSSDGDGDDAADVSEPLSDDDDDDDNNNDLEEGAVQLVSRSLQSQQAVFLPPPPLSSITAPGAPVTVARSNWDYCTICSVVQDGRRKIRHCVDCGYCIEGHDHHCPWMGQCVGKKNMRWFILFNISWIIYFIEFITTAAVLKSRGE